MRTSTFVSPRICLSITSFTRSRPSLSLSLSLPSPHLPISFSMVHRGIPTTLFRVVFRVYRDNSNFLRKVEILSFCPKSRGSIPVYVFSPLPVSVSLTNHCDITRTELFLFLSLYLSFSRESATSDTPVRKIINLRGRRPVPRCPAKCENRENGFAVVNTSRTNRRNPDDRELDKGYALRRSDE